MFSRCDPESIPIGARAAKPLMGMGNGTFGVGLFAATAEEAAADREIKL